MSFMPLTYIHLMFRLQLSLQNIQNNNIIHHLFEFFRFQKLNDLNFSILIFNRKLHRIVIDQFKLVIQELNSYSKLNNNLRFLRLKGKYYLMKVYHQ